MLLTEKIKHDKYIIKDSFDFINRFSYIKLEQNYLMVSFDVVSLFPNVPTDETIQIIKNRFFKNDQDRLDQLDFKQFKKLLEICVNESHISMVLNTYLYLIHQSEPNKIMDKDQKLKFISLPYINEKSE